MRYHLIAFVLLCSASIVGGVTRAGDFAGGTGEPNDPYLIATAEQLLVADFQQPGVYYRLCCDIDLAGRSVWPSHDVFAHLDGDGYAIHHAQIEGRRGVQAFFGFVQKGATITDLTLADFRVTVVSPVDGIPVSHIGGLVGLNAGTIKNCHATGWIVVHDAGTVVGGLVGSNYALVAPRDSEQVWEGVMIGCSFNGAIRSDRSGTLSLGGLAGSNSGVMVNCRAAGAVLGEGSIGGLVGSNDGSGSITNCYATTTVLSERGGGGLVGSNGAQLTRCYASGLVTGNLRGGLAGMDRVYGGTVTGCLWDVFATNCQSSGGGLAMDLAQKWNPKTYAANGWQGDPNWVMEPFVDYPRLVWEGTLGEPIPQPQGWSFAGSGTEDDPYRIASTEQLVELAASSVLWDKHFVLADSLDLSDWPASRWRPVGAHRGASFSGSFDGQGHALSNLNVQHGDVPIWDLGLFGHVTGKVRNIHLENFVFETGMGSQHVGLLVGTCDEGLIESCYASGSITVGADSQAVGELVGYSNGEVVGCSSSVTVVAGEGSAGVGGLVGFDPRRY